MRKFAKAYAGFKWRDRFIVALIIMTLTGTTAALGGLDVPASLLWVAGFLVVMHLLLTKAKELMLGLVILGHLGMLSLSISLYSNFAQMTFGHSGHFFSFLVLSISSLLFFMLAVKFSKGHLWVTMLFIFVALDVGGLILLSMFGIANIFVGLLVPALVLAVRSVLWRDVFTDRKAVFAPQIRQEWAATALKTVVSETAKQNESLTVVEDTYAPIDVVAINGDKAYCLVSLSTRDRVVLAGDDIASGQYNLKPLVYETAVNAMRTAKRKKAFKGKQIIPCIVNMNDKSSAEVEVAVFVKGNKRDEGKNVIILTPSSLMKKLK